ncbi:MAG TPA: PQQ-like beta-propeller repeat protein, partial [Calditrichia bacterium]|nr:PQQ-like beta-propeller repeat protein [Calditrichia bacterium]
MRFFFTLMVIVMTTAGCGNNEPVAKPAKPEASAPAGNEVRILLANHSEEDWNQWRGPLRNGISGEGNILTEWGPQGPPVLWRQNLGAGFSGISVVDNSVYTMYGNAGNDYLVALDAGSGAKRWELKIGEKYRDRMGGDGPRSTPTVIDGRVYVVSAQGKLFAVDAANGKVLWQRDFVAEYGAQIPRWGFSTSVLVYQGKVYAEVGGSGKGFAAFDAQTGEVRWMTQNDQPAYSSPILAVIDEIPQIIFFATSGLVALNPDNGERYWAAPWHTSYDVNAATPIFIAPNQIFISSEYDVGAALYRVNRSTSGKFEAEQIWKNRQMKNKMATSVFLDGYL